MSVAWLFPGQGAQQVGMGRDLYDRFPEARAIFDAADAALGRDLTRVIFDGPEEELRHTVNTQPAIFITSLACLAAARAANHPLVADLPACVAGHSLGEYSALVAAGALSPEDGVRVVQRRGELMQAAGEAQPGTLAAVLGLDEAAVAGVCNATGAEICNINTEAQIVIGGSLETVERAIPAFEAAGARRVVPLNVGGAFHSSLMQPAADGMRDTLADVRLRDPAVPVIGNVEAAPLTSADAIREELARQVRSAVRWGQSVRQMLDDGVDTFVEIGPGTVLTGLVKTIARPATPTLINLNAAETVVPG